MKFPKIYHLPWSESITSDDKVISDSCFNKLISKELIITEKMDGENFSLFCDKLHARSEDSKNHPSRSLIKNIHANIKHNIPNNLQIVGEYLYAVHSIKYKYLSQRNIFQVFCIIDFNKNLVLSWKDTENICYKLGLVTVPIIINSIKIDKNWRLENIKSSFGDCCEGYVVRNKESFLVKDFNYNIAKYVRKNHVKTNEHWSKNWKPFNLK